MYITELYNQVPYQLVSVDILLSHRCYEVEILISQQMNLKLGVETVLLK